MSENVRFTPITAHSPGIIRHLLIRSYENTLESSGGGSLPASAKWPAFDAGLFDCMDTLGNCAFITCAGDQVIGFASWEVRCVPRQGVIGHNCILPEHRWRGYGKTQIQEVLSRLRAAGAVKAVVITGDDPFFMPARRMYLACGFHETPRRACRPDMTYDAIKYELDLTAPMGQPNQAAQSDAIVSLF